MLALDTLLALGIVVNIVKGGDLLLRPHQQRKVQSFFEDVTLKLESLRPIEWLKPLTSERGQRRLLLVGIGEFILLLGVVISRQIWAGEFRVVGSFAVLLNSGALLLSVLTLPFVTSLGGPKLMRWLLGDMRAPAVLRRFALVLITGFAVLGVYQGA